MKERSADPAEIAGYDPVARALHWLVAGLAVVVVSLGLAVSGAPRETESRELLLPLNQAQALHKIAHGEGDIVDPNH